MDFEDGRLKVVGGTLGESSTSLAVRTTEALVHAVHVLRGFVAPQRGAIPKAWRAWDGEGRITHENRGPRPDRLGRLVVESTQKVSRAHEACSRRVETIGSVV